MKVVILAGGYGTRLSEETISKPKPMVEIGDMPILWHIMKLYSFYGYNDFIILLGYKGYTIKEYFANYFLHQSDVTFNTKENSMKVHKSSSDSWNVTLLNTGINTMTGGRIKKIKDYIGNEPFLLTYGDGVSDVNINKLVAFHSSHKNKITMTAIRPEARYGALTFDEDSRVVGFEEKPKGDGSWVNGGFFVCEPSVLEYIENDDTVFEQEPLRQLSKKGEMYAYKHEGFWQCMDTLRDYKLLCELWDKGTAPWKIWS